MPSSGTGVQILSFLDSGVRRNDGRAWPGTRRFQGKSRQPYAAGVSPPITGERVGLVADAAVNVGWRRVFDASRELGSERAQPRERLGELR